MIITLTIEEDRSQISYLDYMPNQVEGKLGLTVFTKDVELNKELSKLDEEKEFLEEVDKSVKIDDELKFRNKEEEHWSRFNLSRLISAGSKVAVNGRRGPADNVLIYKPVFEELLLEEERDSLQRFYKVWFSKEKLDYVLVWRNGALDEPGIILIKNKEKYTFASLGLYPELQFVKISTNT
jgi:hypothetical protein